MSFDPPSWISNSEEIREIYTKSSQNAYEMYKFMNFCNLMKITGKNCWSILKKLIFGQTYMEFDGCHVNIKNDQDAIGISKFLQRMKEQPLKVSAP